MDKNKKSNFFNNNWICSNNKKSRYEEDFETEEEIGHGQFGSVYRCIKRMDGVKYAVKQLHLGSPKASKQTLLQEVYALSALSCRGDFNKHIVRYFSAWCEDSALYIQMELCDITLDKYLKIHKMNEKDIKHLLKSILKGLAFIHSQSIVHLDIKPENIFIHNDIYKIGDLGLATLGNGTLSVMEGDCRYMSPELLNDDYRDLTKSDIFSLGIMIYEILSNKSLPKSGDEWIKIREGKINMSSTYFDLESIIRKMINNDYNKRPSASELLKDKYFQNRKSIKKGCNYILRSTTL